METIKEEKESHAPSRGKRYDLLRVAGILLALYTLSIELGGCSSWMTSRAPSTNPEVSTSQLPPIHDIPIPQLKREFRGVWVATVANIDWPSEQGLSVSEQKKEILAILDRVVELNMNAVVFQVRPAADALYNSHLEPWSEYISGQMGQPPEPYYDPLAFVVEEAHNRGLELHAWFNPFRARHKTANKHTDANHISVIAPELVVSYGEQLWMDPGNTTAQEHSLRVIRDVVRRYDIDGIHIDDYFYPYPVKDKSGRNIVFPDDKSWQKAQAQGTMLSREDWRRQNINHFIERLYATVKQEKPWVKVGISPFGIWRPGNPEPIRGMDAFSTLYADSRLWLQKGWVDYISPQLYWSMNSARQSYTKLYTWWQAQNTRDRHIWPGSAIYRIDAHGWAEDEILNQIRYTRNSDDQSGNILFSMRVLDSNENVLADRLVEDVYDEKALVPVFPWLYEPPLPLPVVSIDVSTRRAMLRIQDPDLSRVRSWVIRARYGRHWEVSVVPGNAYVHHLPRTLNHGPIQEIAVSSVGRTGRESPLKRVLVDDPPPLRTRLGF